MKKNDFSHEYLKLLKYRRKLFPQNIVNAEISEINAFNIATFAKKKPFRKLYRPVKRNIFSTPFIIPLQDNSTISAYLFRKRSEEEGTSSLIIYLHDGGWVLGNMEICCAVCSNICNLTGSAVLALDYRLAPEFKFPIPVEDCFEAYCWALQGARYWKIDPSSIYIMGNGAGGNLAVSVCRLARDRKIKMPAGLILSEPIADCRLRTESIEKYKDNPVMSAKDLNFFISNYMREPKDILDPLFSPLLAIDNSRLPETLIFATAKSPLYDDARLFSKSLCNAETLCKLVVFDDSMYGVLNYMAGKNWKEVMKKTEAFINGIDVNNLN